MAAQSFWRNYDFCRHKDDFMNIFLALMLGAAAGILSGAGFGGGVVLIPALTLIFGQSQHAAQSINLIYFIPTAAFAVFIHARNKQIETKILPKTIIGGVAGAALGSIIALNIQADVLRQIFAIFLFAMGIAEFRKKS